MPGYKGILSLAGLQGSSEPVRCAIGSDIAMFGKKVLNGYVAADDAGRVRAHCEACVTQMNNHADVATNAQFRPTRLFLARLSAATC